MRTLKPNVYDRRPAATESGPPVAMNGFTEEAPPAVRAMLVYSLGKIRGRGGRRSETTSLSAKKRWKGIRAEWAFLFSHM